MLDTLSYFGKSLSEGDIEHIVTRLPVISKGDGSVLSVPICTGMLWTEESKCIACSQRVQNIKMDDAAWGALKEEFPGDWTWMILSLVPSWMLPECTAKHSVGYCRSCAMKPATSMAAGVQYSCPTSGCGHVYTPDQTRLLARFALRLLADKPSLFEVSKRTSNNQGEQSLGNSGLPESEATRHESIFLPRMWPQPYDDKHRPPGAILLYGPPGTGKSDLVKALAKKVNHTFLTMSQVPLYQVLEPGE